MKKCNHCGCFNKNARMSCADCGHSLAGAAKAGEAEMAVLDAKLEKASRYSDPFSFKPRHQIIFYASLALIAAAIVLAVMSLLYPVILYGVILSSGVCVLFTRFPEGMWKMEKFFIKFRVRGDVEPSDWWFIGREIVIFGFFGVSCALLALGLTNDWTIYDI